MSHPYNRPNNSGASGSGPVRGGSVVGGTRVHTAGATITTSSQKVPHERELRQLLAKAERAQASMDRIWLAINHEYEGDVRNMPDWTNLLGQYESCLLQLSEISSFLNNPYQNSATTTPFSAPTQTPTAASASTPFSTTFVHPKSYINPVFFFGSKVPTQVPQPDGSVQIVELSGYDWTRVFTASKYPFWSDKTKEIIKEVGQGVDELSNGNVNGNGFGNAVASSSTLPPPPPPGSTTTPNLLLPPPKPPIDPAFKIKPLNWPARTPGIDLTAQQESDHHLVLEKELKTTKERLGGAKSILEEISGGFKWYERPVVAVDEDEEDEEEGEEGGQIEGGGLFGEEDEIPVKNGLGVAGAVDDDDDDDEEGMEEVGIPAVGSGGGGGGDVDMENNDDEDSLFGGGTGDTPTSIAVPSPAPTRPTISQSQPQAQEIIEIQDSPSPPRSSIALPPQSQNTSSVAGGAGRTKEEAVLIDDDDDDDEDMDEVK